MREIRKSGSMSGERKRSDAERLKLPRLSSTLLRQHGEEAALEAAKRADAMAGAEAEPKIGLAICVSALCP